MARILLMSTGEKGHLNPLVGVAQWARRLGHEVAWLCIPEPAPQLAALGVPCVPLDVPPPPPHVTGGPELARLVRSGEELRLWIKSLLLDAVPAQIEPVRRALRAWAPHAVALDPMLYQGVISCHHEDIPVIGVSSSCNPVTPLELDFELGRTARWLDAARHALFAEHGVAPRFRVCDHLGGHTTVFATAAFVGDVDVPSGVELVGPSVPPELRGDEVSFPWDALDDARPLVYASFGSQISHQPALFERIARACHALSWQLVCSAGALADTDWARALPGAPVVVPYAPQRALLERARVLITHGGANSVMEALTAGVPLLVSPVCNDQFAQAFFVAKSGVGEALDLHEATFAQLALALERLHAEGPARRAVERVGATYRAADGARTVAERLTALAGANA